jgi:hypothetical protein
VVFSSHGKSPESGFSGWVLSDLLSVFESEQGVFYRQYRLYRHGLKSVSSVESAKYRNLRNAGVIQW